MSKPRKRKQKPELPQPMPQLVLTHATIQLLAQALAALERAFVQIRGELPNVPFAQEVVAQLKVKLEHIRQINTWEEEAFFDYNEMLILYAAVHVYLADVRCSQRYELLRPCIELCRQVGQVVEALNLLKRSRR